MPKLHDYIERQYLNLYDCASPRDFLSDGRARLFGDKNFGNLAKTNMVVVGEVTKDQTAVIGNWYARTNIDRSIPQFEQWAHTAVASLVVGCMPVTQRPVYELLQARPGDNMEFSPTYSLSATDAAARRDYFAKIALDGWQPMGGEFDLNLDFNSLSEDFKDRWEGVAYSVARGVGRGIHVVIPVRQSYSVYIDADPMATRALLEVMPAVSPQALVWVHIEGVQARFHA